MYIIILNTCADVYLYPNVHYFNYYYLYNRTNSIFYISLYLTISFLGRRLTSRLSSLTTLVVNRLTSLTAPTL